jgi:diaminohydroxyphosphoribosylaminopyrimidine deaminase/5-amino-6-(5-phosphoribosylamino)uracil reductase
MQAHEKFMNIAIEAAKAGIGKTFPKPSVGAVLVDENQNIIAISHTSEKGIHAEPQAISIAAKKAKGSSLYVTLEPCNHYGKTPPCTKAIISSGKAKVVIANKDINPIASGGSEELKQAGIEVVTGVLSEKANSVNQAFFTRIQKNRPYIIAKLAISEDKKISNGSSEKFYISGKTSLNYVHSLRNKMDGILVGINTIINDDPMLNCRLEGVSKKLVKIILDTNLKTPINANIIKNSDKEPVIIFSEIDSKKYAYAEIINETNINSQMRILAEKGVERLLIEGGAKIFANFILNDLIDEIQLIKSKIIIGEKGTGLFENDLVRDKFNKYFMPKYTRNFEEDILTVYTKNQANCLFN